MKALKKKKSISISCRNKYHDGIKNPTIWCIIFSWKTRSVSRLWPKSATTARCRGDNSHVQLALAASSVIFCEKLNVRKFLQTVNSSLSYSTWDRNAAQSKHTHTHKLEHTQANTPQMHTHTHTHRSRRRLISVKSKRHFVGAVQAQNSSSVL